jgi:hypothetical protein
MKELGNALALLLCLAFNTAVVAEIAEIVEIAPRHQRGACLLRGSIDH